MTKSLLERFKEQLQPALSEQYRVRHEEAARDAKEAASVISELLKKGSSKTFEHHFSVRLSELQNKPDPKPKNSVVASLLLEEASLRNVFGSFTKDHANHTSLANGGGVAVNQGDIIATVMGVLIDAIKTASGFSDEKIIRKLLKAADRAASYDGKGDVIKPLTEKEAGKEVKKEKLQAVENLVNLLMPEESAGKENKSLKSFATELLSNPKHPELSKAIIKKSKNSSLPTQIKDSFIQSSNLPEIKKSFRL